MRQNLEDFIAVEDEESADIVVVNSCTVTNSADGNARHYINSLHRNNKQVILAGCGALSKGESLYQDKKVFGVMGHSEKANINALLKSQSPFFQLGDLTSVDETIVDDFSSKSKAFIKIQEGCDFRCSYCIIPTVRGNARSQKEDKILNQIKTLAQNGYGEFVLTGTNIGSYGKDTKSSIAQLLQKIALISGVKRVRLGSLEPVQIDDAFKELLGESWLEKHLHIALQHTNEEMLRIMRRRNALKSDLALFEFISDKGFALGTDFIVGHPGESEARFEDGLRHFKQFPITHLHCFSYSDREGTHASKLDERVPGNIAKERLKILESIVKKNNYTFRRENQKQLLVLVEENKGGLQSGYDQYYNKITIESPLDLHREWITIDDYKITKEGTYATVSK